MRRLVRKNSGNEAVPDHSLYAKFLVANAGKPVSQPCGQICVLVGAAGIEPATAGLEIRCSIRLSYAPFRWIQTIETTAFSLPHANGKLLFPAHVWRTIPIPAIASPSPNRHSRF